MAVDLPDKSKLVVLSFDNDPQEDPEWGEP